MDIVWQTKRTGRVTPVLEVESIELSGANVSRVTAHHAGNVKALQLGKGAVISVERSGEAVSYTHLTLPTTPYV